MKKLIILLFLITSLFAQQLKVDSIEKIETNQDFYYPNFGSSENEIFLTRINYQGIFKMNLLSKEITQINNDLGAGYNYVINNESVYYRAEELIDNRRFFKYIQQNLSSLNKSELTQLERNITTPKLYNNYLVKLNSNNEMQRVKIVSNLQKADSKEVLISNNKLLVIDNSGINELNIFSNGYYLWASISPDQNKIVFHYSGKGTFVSDLQGNIIRELGNANFPSWSSDGKYIIYMNDEDDGHSVLSSDVLLYNYESEQRVNLTADFDDIAMYPSISDSMNKILFSNMKGEIYIINLISE